MMTVERPKTTLEILIRIRRSPGMWLGHETLQGLQYFILGIRSVSDFSQVLPPDSIARLNDFPWREFEAFVENQHREQRPLTLHSFGLAQYIAAGESLTDFPRQDYPGAWELWWKWFDEFMESRQK
jgi:hypothetical protein